MQYYQRRQWHPTPVLLRGKSHGQRSLVGCSPWGRWGSDTTERLHFHFSLSCIREGNGNPLQCSCLENPGDGGAWWAAIYGVAQSPTRLKWLSSSSSMRYYAADYVSWVPRLTLLDFEQIGLTNALSEWNSFIYRGLTVYPFYRCLTENWGSERLDKLPKVTQITNSNIRF